MSEHSKVSMKPAEKCGAIPHCSAEPDSECDLRAFWFKNQLVGAYMESHSWRTRPGESKQGCIRVEFNHRVKLALHGSTIISDAGLLAYREVYDAVELTEVAVRR